MTAADAAPDAAPAPSPDPAPPGRGISPIAGRFGTGRAGRGVTLLALCAGSAVFLAATWKHGKAQPPAAPPEPARQVVAFEPAPTPAQTPTLAHPGPDAPQLGPSASAPAPAGPPPAEAVAQRAAELQAIRGAPLMVVGGPSIAAPGAGGAVDATSPPVVPAVRPTAAATELEQLRHGSAIGRAKARRLGDRSFLLLAGATLPCLLQTAMDTATPGYVSCLIPQDVYSDNGAVVLMEKGTKVLGEYRSGLRQGQKRLFVLWTRAVTPAGVAIELASPASDPLGRAGFDGDLDTFFWRRFGGALLLSVVDDAATAAAARGNSGTINAVPSDAAGIALQNAINIPPVLRKPPGAEVAIFVAQDFDFSSVYGLEARGP
jgi:type IV secretion system protein VirB10